MTMDPVTESALVKRINRALAHDVSKIVRSRSLREQAEFGRYYLTANNVVTDWHVDIVKLAEALEVIAHNEVVANEPTRGLKPFAKVLQDNEFTVQHYDGGYLVLDPDGGRYFETLAELIEFLQLYLR